MRYAPMLVAPALLAFTLLAGCFPHNAQHRRKAKWIEGGALAGGIAMLAVSNTGADCAAGPMNRGTSYDDCRRTATIIGDIGLGLILAGLVGFAATTMMVAEEKPKALQPLAQERTVTTDEPESKPALPGRTATRPNKH